MQSAFDARTRFVLLWILTETWFPALVALATPRLVESGSVAVLAILSFAARPITALSQLPLLRGHVDRLWLWFLAGLATALLSYIAFNVILTGMAGGLLPVQGGGMAAWMPFFLLSGLLFGLAAGLPQAPVIGQWRLGSGGWILVVIGAAIIAAAIGGVIWVMGGMGGSAATPAPWAGLVSTVARSVAFGSIVGVYLWHRLAQRSVDAAGPAA